MTETTDRAMSTPNGWGDAPLPKRNGHKGLLPSTWLERTLRVEYSGADGKVCSTTGVLLDWFPFGPVLNVDGSRTAFSWERIAVIELAED